MEKVDTQKILCAAENCARMSTSRDGRQLDYSEASLVVIEDMLEEASEFSGQMKTDQIDMLVADFGCYILEVGRRAFNGRYLWYDQRKQPVLVVGEPKFKVAMISWDRVRGRLLGDAADNIPFFYAGFAERARAAKPGTDVLFV